MFLFLSLLASSQGRTWLLCHWPHLRVTLGSTALFQSSWHPRHRKRLLPGFPEEFGGCISLSFTGVTVLVLVLLSQVPRLVVYSQKGITFSLSWRPFLKSFFLFWNFTTKFFFFFWLFWVFVAVHRLSLSCDEWGLLFIAACELLTAVASLVVEHGQASVVVAHVLSSCGSQTLECRLSSCGTRA